MKIKGRKRANPLFWYKRIIRYEVVPPELWTTHCAFERCLVFTATYRYEWGKENTARLTLTAQVDIELQQCFPQHTTFGKATISHELNTNTNTTVAYLYRHKFFTFLEVEVFPIVSIFSTSLHSYEKTTLIKPRRRSCVRVWVHYMNFWLSWPNFVTFSRKIMSFEATVML